MDKFVVSLLFLLILPLQAYDRSGSYYDRYEKNVLHIGVYEMSGGSFNLENYDTKWDSAKRYEVNARYHMALLGKRETFGGGFVFWEERRAEDGTAGYLSNKVFGAGLEGGMNFYFHDNPGRRSFNIILAPYSRFGLGLQNAVLRDIELPEGDANGKIGELRLDLGVGMDLQFQFQRSFVIGIGAAGMLWWSGGSTVVEVDQSGGAVVRQPVSFNGDEIQYRITIGVNF